MTPLATAVFAALLSLSPPDATAEQLPGWAETAEARRDRYRSIADDVAAVVEERVTTSGACGSLETCRARAAGMLLGIARHESGFAADVDAGRCYRGRDGKGPRCDGGAAHSMWQLRSGGEEAALFDRDRRAAAREALRRAGRSIGACRALPKEEQLVAYAGGRCVTPHPVAVRRARELHAAAARAFYLVNAAMTAAKPVAVAGAGS
jgi:hypothetical protein